jgi:amino acid transporter
MGIFMEERNKISIWTAILVNINIMVGAGIFAYSQITTQKAGYASFLGWPIVALIFLPVVLSIATISRMFPGQGSFYAYAKNLISPTVGFASGWLFFSAYVSTSSILTLCFRKTILDIITNNLGISVPLILFNIIFITLVTLLSFLSINIFAKVQNMGTILKIIPLLFIIAIFLFYLNPNFKITSGDLSQVGSVLPLALFGYWGFECCCAISHLIKGRKSNASTAILVAFGITAFVYTAFHFGLLNIMGQENLAKYGAIGVVNFLVMPATVKAIVAFLFSFAIATVFLFSVFGMFTVNSATLHALADENLLPFSKQLKKTNRFERPWVAILAQGILTFCIISVTDNIPLLNANTNFGILSIFFITLFALMMLQIKNKSYAQMIVTILAFISCSLFTYYSWIGAGQDSISRFIGISPILLAFVFGMGSYFYIKNKNKLAQVR